MEDAGYPGWEHPVDLPGALIEPCCKQAYLLGLIFTVDGGRATGSARGIVITYRLEDGRTFRSHVPVAMTFCTAETVEHICKDAEDAALDRYVAEKRVLSSPPEDFREPATWPEGS